MTEKERRSFIKTSGFALSGVMIPFHILKSTNFRRNSDTLKVELIGRWGRGTGSAVQALNADQNVHLTAMGDIFPDRLEKSYRAIMEEHPKRTRVDEVNNFIGFDVYQRVIDSDVDVVLLAAPPYARPEHMSAAVKAGKHVFAEKPVAVDAPGVREILKAAKMAEEKNLTLVSGLCFRYNNANQAVFGRILDGAAGDIRSVTGYRYGGE